MYNMFPLGSQYNTDVTVLQERQFVCNYKNLHNITYGREISLITRTLLSKWNMQKDYKLISIWTSLTEEISVYLNALN